MVVRYGGPKWFRSPVHGFYDCFAATWAVQVEQGVRSTEYGV